MDNWKFNVSVGREDPPVSMEDLMIRAEEYAKSGNWILRQTCLEAASERGCQPAMLRLAQFLLDAPGLNLSQAERCRRCEKLLLALERNTETLGSTEQLLTFMKLYCKTGRIMAAYGYGLRARRLGGKPDASAMRALNRQLDLLAVEAVRQDIFGARILCQELAETEGVTRRVLAYLHEAADHDSSGMAALEAGDLCNHFGLTEEASQFYRQAEPSCPSVIRLDPSKKRRHAPARPSAHPSAATFTPVRQRSYRMESLLYTGVPKGS